MGIPKLTRSDEKGATIVEAAIVYGLLFLVLFAVLEFGLAFKDWLSLSHASREGARAGATYGDDPRADIQILRGVEGTLGAASISNGLQVRVFKPGGLGTNYTYTPGSDCSDLSGGTLTEPCCDWTPCPEPFRATYTVPVWDPASRDVSAPTTDRIGVLVRFMHNWITGFLAGSADFEVTTDFSIEPQVFGP